MLNFEHYVDRHGEFGVQAIIERLERYEGVRTDSDLLLEQRWNVLMQNTHQQPLAA